MAATPASIQVAVVLAAALLATTANPTPGLGNIIGSFQGAPAAGGEPNRGNGFSDIITFPKPVINAFLGNRRPLAPPAAAHSHGQGTSSAPTSAATPIPTPTPTSTSTSTPPPSPTTAATTTAAVHHTPPPSAAPAATEGTEKPASQTVEHSQNVAGNYTAEELEKCRQKWVEVANTTINENVDILTILLDYGGFPGQMSSIKWERNATDDHPDRWTYFFGDSDYKTYIRNEVGEIYSKSYPVRGATPVSLSGNIYWTPADFCGKLRHAKYTQWEPSECDLYGENVSPMSGRCYWTSHENNTFTLCQGGSSNAWLLPRTTYGTCETARGNKGAVSYGCLVSLVCGG